MNWELPYLGKQPFCLWDWNTSATATPAMSSTNIHWMVLSATMETLGVQEGLIALRVIPAPRTEGKPHTSEKKDFYALKWNASHCDVVMRLFQTCCALSVYIYYLTELSKWSGFRILSVVFNPNAARKDSREQQVPGAPHEVGVD